MKKTALFLILLLSMTSGVFAGLTNLCTSVMDNGMIEITYQLVSEDPTNTLPVFAVSFTGEIAGKKPFDLKTLEGAGKTGVLLGEGSYTSYWNVAKDCKREDPFAITVNAEAEEVTDEATYLCLDLKKYKMRYQNDPPDVTKSACKTKELWLRRIEPGIFTMGSPENEVGRYEDEYLHKMQIANAYYIGIFEVTQKQFKALTGYNFSQYKGAARPVENVSYTMLRGNDKGANWPKDQEVDEYGNGNISDKHFHDYEVNNVPTFFYALREKAGNTYQFDLPTEAHWEYACRAKTTSAFNDGSNLVNINSGDDNLNKLARYRYNGGYVFDKWYYIKSMSGHTKVGSYLPNDWGLYDMHGNIGELCLDWYGDPQKDPTGPATGVYRVLRGGSWVSHANGCRSAGRSGCDPDFGNIYYGFRVALVQNEDVFPVSDGPIIPKIQKNFEFETSSGIENTLSVFEVKLYGKLANGVDYPLGEIGKVEYDGASGIVIGKGKHKLTWIPNDDYTNYVDEVELRVEYKDVTEAAKYLVLDLPSNKMRVSQEEPNITDDLCRTEELWLRRIEPGTFTMGSPYDELGRYSNETPHQVTLTEAYYIGVFEITQKQFIYITGSNPSIYLGDIRPVDNVFYNNIRGSENGSAWPANYDVDETSFMGMLRRRAGNIFDLPTEAQWEYACRAGTTTALNSGKNLKATKKCSNMAKVGRYAFSYAPIKLKESHCHLTASVGSYLPNAWGLYDMHGNVLEWCLDWYDEYDIDDVVTNPKGATDKVKGYGRVLRGGCFALFRGLAMDCRSAFRLPFGFPDRGDPGSRCSVHGFRVALVQ